MTVSEDCANGRDIRATYELSYNTGSGTHISTCDVDGTECNNNKCHHELQSNTANSRCQPPLSQFSGESVTVSVTARNIVGRSNPAVSRIISELSKVELQVKSLSSVKQLILACLLFLFIPAIEVFSTCRTM